MTYYKIKLDSDLYTYEYFGQSDVCRLCWRRNAFIELSSIENGLKESIFEKIYYCFDITIESNSFPNKLCDECLKNIKNFYRFKQFCKESDKRLKELLKLNLNIQVKIEKYNDENDGDIDTFCTQNSPIKSECEVENLQVELNNKKRKYEKKQYPESYCKKCQMDYTDTERFVEHNKHIHGNFPEGIYKCFGCDRRFRNIKTRLGHETNYCKGLRKGYFCNICARYLPKRSMYETHKFKHSLNLYVAVPDDIFKCIKCKMLFKTRDSLKKHHEEQHKKKKQAVCELCGQVFKHINYLTQHMLTHNGLKKHICPHCGHRTTQKSTLNVHMRKHTGVRPFACDQCPMKCATSSNLTAHKLKHTGVKRYECAHCPKKFGYKTSLEEHISAVHDRIKRFTCTICNTSFARSGRLRRHVQSQHGKVASEELNIDNEKNDYIEVTNKNLLTKTMDNIAEENVYNHDNN